MLCVEIREVANQIVFVKNEPEPRKHAGPLNVHDPGKRLLQLVPASLFH